MRIPEVMVVLVTKHKATHEARTGGGLPHSSSCSSVRPHSQYIASTKRAYSP